MAHLLIHLFIHQHASCSIHLLFPVHLNMKEIQQSHIRCEMGVKIHWCPKSDVIYVLVKSLYQGFIFREFVKAIKTCFVRYKFLYLCQSRQLFFQSLAIICFFCLYIKALFVQTFILWNLVVFCYFASQLHEIECS